MSFIKPQLASPMKSDFTITNDAWVAEEKYDGHRLVVVVKGSKVQAWSRDENPRILPPHVRTALAQLPDGTYDGELISTEKTKSYGVTDLEQADKLCFVIFDILRVGEHDATHQPYSYRRELITTIFRDRLETAGVTYAAAMFVANLREAMRFAKTVWDRGGEGLILKNIHEPYTPGKRAKHWIKIKKNNTAVLTVIGFVAGLLGPCATVLLEDNEGFQTTVKTLNTKEREAAQKNPGALIGRKLRIEYQERTPDGGYRHPMWDRWEDQ